MKKRLLSPEDSNGETIKFEQTLRPATLDEYIGQTEIKNNLAVFIKAAKNRGESLEHILIHGPPGLGKTTLANIIAAEMGVNIRITSGPALEKQGDLASIISSLKDKDVLFIDEIHRLRPAVEEVLYTAMEDFGIDLIIGKGPSARTMRLNLPKFTLIGATTKISMLSSPLRDRFGSLFHLHFYDERSIEDIIKRSSSILKCDIYEEACKRLAKSARNTPRIANRLLRRVRDFADVEGLSVIDIQIVNKALKALGIDDIGLDNVDRRILETIIMKFEGGPVGLNTIAASISEEESTVEDIYEPYLIKLGLLERTSRGRLVTKSAYTHLNIINKISHEPNS